MELETFYNDAVAVLNSLEKDFPKPFKPEEKPDVDFHKGLLIFLESEGLIKQHTDGWYTLTAKSLALFGVNIEKDLKAALSGKQNNK